MFIALIAIWRRVGIHCHVLLMWPELPQVIFFCRLICRCTAKLHDKSSTSKSLPWLPVRQVLILASPPNQLLKQALCILASNTVRQKLKGCANWKAEQDIILLHYYSLELRLKRWGSRDTKAEFSLKMWSEWKNFSYKRLNSSSSSVLLFFMLAEKEIKEHKISARRLMIPHRLR